MENINWSLVLAAFILVFVVTMLMVFWILVMRWKADRILDEDTYEELKGAKKILRHITRDIS